MDNKSTADNGANKRTAVALPQKENDSENVAEASEIMAEVAVLQQFSSNTGDEDFNEFDDIINNDEDAE